MLQPLVILTGPTAVGKTSLSIALAKATEGEIISADSMQVYRGMDIGTAKIRPEEMDGVRHHMIDVLDPDEACDVLTYKRMVTDCIKEITGRGHLPILVGGTGFYLQAVLYDIAFTEEESGGRTREAVTAFYEAHGKEALYQRLVEVDPEYAASLSPNNVKKVIRAVEYYETTGGKLSEHNAREREREAAYNAAYFVLTMDRQRLYERIDRRVDVMVAEGLVDEVRGLMQQGYTRDLVSMQGIGYKEVIDALNGECGMEEAIARIKQASRHYAKRQLTWFRRERDVIWFDKEQKKEEEILQEMIQILRERGITKDGADSTDGDL